MKTGETTKSLADYTFDDDDVFKEFAGDSDTGTSSAPTKLGAIRGGADPVFGDDDEDDEGGVTKIDKDGDGEKPTKVDKTPTAKAKPKEKGEKGEGTKPARPGKKDEEDEEDEEDEDDEPDEDDFKFEFGPEKDEPKPDKKEKPVAKKKEETDDEPDDGDEKREPVEIGEDFYKNLVLDLKEAGTLASVEIKDDEEISAERFVEIQEEEIESRVQEAIEAFAEDFDQDGKDFIKFKKNGGKTSDFIRSYLAPTFTLKEFDEDNKAHVSQTIDHYLRTVEGLEGDDLADRKEWLKNGGKEASKAKTYFEKIQAADARRKAAIMKQVEAKNKADEEDAEAFNEEIVDTIAELKGLGDFTLSETDKKILPAYMTKPMVKVGKNKFVPKLHADLSRVLKAATQKDRERYIILAKIFASDFKIPNLKASLETKVTKEAKLRIKRSSPKGTTGSSARVKSLADMFEEPA